MNNLGKQVSVEKDKNKLVVNASIDFSKRYMLLGMALNCHPVLYCHNMHRYIALAKHVEIVSQLTEMFY